MTTEWPSREEWSLQVRLRYWADAVDIRVSTTLADYATPSEIADLIAALTAQRRTYEVGSSQRDECNRTLHLVTRGEVPVRYQGACDYIVEPIRRRWRAAWEAAVAAARPQQAEPPIDDAAWEQELKRRRDLERAAGEEQEMPPRGK